MGVYIAMIEACKDEKLCSMLLSTFMYLCNQFSSAGKNSIFVKMQKNRSGVRVLAKLLVRVRIRIGSIFYQLSNLISVQSTSQILLRWVRKTLIIYRIG